MSYSQTLRQKKMSNLKFLVGEWIGTSMSYKDGKMTNKVSAFEKIEYDLDGNIIKIDLNSEALQLHTIIYYSENDSTYYYNPFYKTGAAKYKAEFKDGKFIVNPSETKRFIFTLNKEGNFTEYGETLVNGKWVKYFEDIFKNTN